MFDRRPLSGALLLAALGLGLVSSCDNPTCVFVDGCTGSNGGNGPGGLGNNGATFPADGAFMSAGAPTLVAAAPQIQDLHPRSPLFLEFSESLSPDGLSEAFRVLDVVFQQEIPLAPAGLVGNGRVVALTPAAGASMPYRGHNSCSARCCAAVMRPARNTKLRIRRCGGPPDAGVGRVSGMPCIIAPQIARLAAFRA